MQRIKSKKKKNRSGNRDNAGGVKLGPPSYVVNMRQKRFIIRYEFTADQNATGVQFNAFVRLMLAKSAAATVAGGLVLFNSIRLRAIHLYGPAQVAPSLSNADLGLEFIPIASGASPPPNGVDVTRVVNSSTSTAGSPYVCKRPDKASQHGAWLNANSWSSAAGTTMFVVSGAMGTIMDLDVEFVITDGTFNSTYTSSAVTALGPGMYAVLLAGGIQPIEYPSYS